MVGFNAQFDLKLFGSANTATKDDWYDIGALSVIPAHSPIPAGKQLRVGFLNLGSQDKGLDWELRANTSGQSTGTVGNTVLLASTATDPSAGSKWEDLFQNGAISPTVAPLAASTGVEKLWLRVQSGSNTVAAFDWFIYYSLDG
jgi:hypothetical protein